MDNFEILKETKICYEYINDILQNSDVSDKNIQTLSKTLDSLSDIYSTTYNEMLKTKKERSQLETNLDCPHCSNKVVISDLIDYAYLCKDCDENMYLGEGDLNSEWYHDDSLVKLVNDFDIHISYNKDEGNVYIGTDNSSGAKYRCNNLSTLSEVLKSYMSNYVLYDEFYIKIWETEEDRDIGESFDYLETYYDLDSAIEETKKILSRQNYAYAEVIRGYDNEVLYSSDGLDEKFYFDDERGNEKDELLSY